MKNKIGISLVVLVSLVTLLAMSGTAMAGTWSESDVSATSSVTLSNTDISIHGSDAGYVSRLEYPLGTGNTFMEYATAGGEAYAVRYPGAPGGVVGYMQGGMTYNNWIQTGLSMVQTGTSTDGAIQVVDTVQLPATGKYFTVTYDITNIGSTTLTDVKFYQYVEPNADNSNTETTAYDTTRGMMYSYNTHYLGVADCRPDEWDLGDFWPLDLTGVQGRILADALNNAIGPHTGDTGHALEYDIGTLNPGQTHTITFYFMVGDSLLEIQSIMDTLKPCVIQVYVDIKPGSCPNPLNKQSKGVLPVAVLGTADFDVTTIDPETILLSREDVDGGVDPIRWSYEDVATPFEGELCDCHDLDGDGILDLTLKFDTQELVETLELSDEAGNTIPLTLTGNLMEEDGGTAIEGEDCILVLEL